MKAMDLSQIARASEGRLTGGQGERTIVTSVSTDTRQLRAGSLFVALRGERFDGHKFLDEAMARGAVAAMVAAGDFARPQGLWLVEVNETRKAMGRLARHVRRELGATVIGVAGSNGKTGTKNLIDSALRKGRRGTISPKSFNNDIGVPVTIFGASQTDDYLVLEMGTNHPGEIEALTRIAWPDIAVITVCAAEHLEFLGDLDGVRRENAAVVRGLSDDGWLVVNGDDAELLKAVGDWPRGRTITFGLQATNDLFAADIACSIDGVRFKLNGQAQVSLPLLGKHQAVNSLAAIAVARRLGLSDEQIISSLASATGPEMRLELQRINGIQVLNDAYNANPSSMRAALDTLTCLPGRRRIAVLGDMKELGDASGKFHEEVGAMAAEARVDALVCVGAFAQVLADSAQRAGLRSPIHVYPNTLAAAGGVGALLEDGDLVLIKGSRAMKMEAIAHALLAH
jgi:UDP-N-acetylmuramoyl-tripeptide--D-alanyl-D-alanine ligase